MWDVTQIGSHETIPSELEVFTGYDSCCIPNDFQRSVARRYRFVTVIVDSGIFNVGFRTISTFETESCDRDFQVHQTLAISIFEARSYRFDAACEYDVAFELLLGTAPENEFE